MNKKDLVRELCYRLRARHVRALDFEYILLVESGDDRPPIKKHHKQVRKAPTKSCDRKTGIIVTYLP
jgi:hypothetical protein